MKESEPFVVTNRTRGMTVAASVQLADTPRSRRIGLLKHESLEAGNGLWIFPTQAIHTFGMRFPIDVVFLDRALRVKKIYQKLAPFRLTSLVWGAQSVLELPSGAIAETGTSVGDELEFSRRSGKAATTALVVMLAFLSMVTGCVRHVTSGPDYGLNGGNSSAHKIVKPTQEAFDPLVDDSNVQELKAKLKLNPEDAAVRLDLGLAYENYRLFDAASEQYNEALKASKNDTIQQAAMGLGRCAQALGRTRELLPTLEDVSKKWPAAGVWDQLALMYEELGDLPAGANAFKEALVLEPASDRLHNNLGYNWLLQNKSQDAEAEFRKALELNPSSITAHNNLGVLLGRRGDTQGALDEFQAGAGTDAATAHNNLAVVLLEMGQYEQSRDELVKALAIRHNFAPALANFKLVQERIRAGSALSKNP